MEQERALLEVVLHELHELMLILVTLELIEWDEEHEVILQVKQVLLAEREVHLHNEVITTQYSLLVSYCQCYLTQHLARLVN